MESTKIKSQDMMDVVGGVVEEVCVALLNILGQVIAPFTRKSYQNYSKAKLNLTIKCKSKELVSKTSSNKMPQIRSKTEPKKTQKTQILETTSTVESFWML